MDCTDCHNTTGHRIAPTPEKAVDRAIASGRLSARLPFIRREAVRLLKAEQTTEQAGPRRHRPRVAEGLSCVGYRGGPGRLSRQHLPGDEGRPGHVSRQHRPHDVQRMLPLPRRQPHRQGRLVHQRRLRVLPRAGRGPPVPTAAVPRRTDRQRWRSGPIAPRVGRSGKLTLAHMPSIRRGLRLWVSTLARLPGGVAGCPRPEGLLRGAPAGCQTAKPSCHEAAAASQCPMRAADGTACPMHRGDRPRCRPRLHRRLRDAQHLQRPDGGAGRATVEPGRAPEPDPRDSRLHRRRGAVGADPQLLSRLVAPDSSPPRA